MLQQKICDCFEMTIKFDEPPINELVIGMYFSPPLTRLHAEHIGFFWSKVHNQFPKSQNAAPIGMADIMGMGMEDVFPLPRFWFISEDESMLIQIQKNAFLLNWRKRQGQYPHYENVKGEFDKYYREFEKFIKTFVGIEDIYIDRCELSYINQIPEGDLYRGVDDIKKILPSITFPDAGYERPFGVNIKTSYKATDNITLTTTIQNRIGKDEEKKERHSLHFELRASEKLADTKKSEADRFFEEAHEAIGKCFLKMISKEARNVWKVKEAS